MRLALRIRKNLEKINEPCKSIIENQQQNNIDTSRPSERKGEHFHFTFHFQRRCPFCYNFNWFLFIIELGALFSLRFTKIGSHTCCSTAPFIQLFFKSIWPWKIFPWNSLGEFHWSDHGVSNRCFFMKIMNLELSSFSGDPTAGWVQKEEASRMANRPHLRLIDCHCEPMNTNTRNLIRSSTFSVKLLK